MPVPLHLPDPIDERLQHSPLRLVVCQVRHSKTVGVSDAGLLLQVQERLGERYPDATAFEQHELVFAAGPAGANASAQKSQLGWQLKSEDGWTVTLQTEFFSLETSSYADWADFRSRFSELLQTVAESYAPKLEQRLGLRYVDEIERPDLAHPADWRDRIDGAVLGPVADPDLGPSVRVAQQVLEFDGPDNSRVILRHGCEPRGDRGPGTVYRLDHDCFRQRARPFAVDTIIGTLEGLHHTALSLFQRTITSSLYSELKGDGVAE